jgi:toxin ParE1/3/4
MTSSRKLRLSPLAEEDLHEILQHTADLWGERQQLIYGKAIAAALETLKSFPEIGKRREDLRAGLRGYIVKEHVILYRVEPDRIRVLRIVSTRYHGLVRFDEDEPPFGP